MEREAVKKRRTGTWERLRETAGRGSKENESRNKREGKKVNKSGTREERDERERDGREEKGGQQRHIERTFSSLAKRG